MRKVCAWCSMVMSAGDGHVSHGICDKCAREVMQQIPMLALTGDFMELLNSPAHEARLARVSEFPAARMQ